MLTCFFLCLAAVSNVIMALPAAAEAGKLFDFNLTLPISEYHNSTCSSTRQLDGPAAAAAASCSQAL
jgi:hypothetical protein